MTCHVGYSMKTKKAVWYDIEDNTWAFGTLKNLGGTASSLESIEHGCLDPPRVPGSKWRYYSKTEGWKQIGQDDIIIKKGDKEAILSFINERTALLEIYRNENIE